MSSIDQFLNMDLMSEIAGSPALTTTSLPAIVGDDPTLDSNGMTFAEMFRFVCLSLSSRSTYFSLVFGSTIQRLDRTIGN
jgi:hypothetical protein